MRHQTLSFLCLTRSKIIVRVFSPASRGPGISANGCSHATDYESARWYRRPILLAFRTSVGGKTDTVGDEACDQDGYDLASPVLILPSRTDGYAFQPAKRENIDGRHQFGNSLLDSATVQLMERTSQEPSICQSLFLLIPFQVLRRVVLTCEREEVAPLIWTADINLEHSSIVTLPDDGGSHGGCHVTGYLKHKADIRAPLRSVPAKRLGYCRSTDPAVSACTGPLLLSSIR